MDDKPIELYQIVHKEIFFEKQEIESNGCGIICSGNCVEFEPISFWIR